ncbi:MAG: hypothetical protein K0R38_4479 [Polyangiaceae bacterium]|nr:hypothetical protein [Polyangiaceae bacterium]
MLAPTEAVVRMQPSIGDAIDELGQFAPVWSDVSKSRAPA